jgi:hypothetical protein
MASQLENLFLPLCFMLSLLILFFNITIYWVFCIRGIRTLEKYRGILRLNIIKEKFVYNEHLCIIHASSLNLFYNASLLYSMVGNKNVLKDGTRN